jgi:hypothetical protein
METTPESMYLIVLSISLEQRKKTKKKKHGNNGLGKSLREN